ncbi:hypothetical protein GT360_07260 [Vibrio astriarenae]|uniref:Uncharacterized protein n=1 Tax=Vibrio astriarenae TaxID=1481923 RepID=A0A7Z2T2U2_9VIBR|nr:hypothetical protein [Vibrio astriarenae]QIA63328.1 hypothetical protein GT360_07260 [Vibrio astriarenae]
MASKNPVKGFIRCHMPDCGCISTVHAVGEHKILTVGEPPKNQRNTGRLYFNCPNCGFQQGKGEQFQAFIKANMSETKEGLNSPETNKTKVSEPAAPPVVAEPKPVIEAVTETEPKPVKTRLEALTPYLAAAAALIALFLFIHKGTTKQHATA